LGKVYITGAGPGDIELLTIKALKIIKQADVIVYDNLINNDILNEAKENCEFIYVGKKRSHHTLKQEEINELLYNLSSKYNIVVRLKGGDPTIFGRGAEEALYLKEKNIEFEFIPGVSSIYAVAECENLPITHRELSKGFRVVSGHKSKKDNLNWESFNTEETIIFLMGLHNIENIAKKLISIGKPKNYPVAVISNGTTKNSKVVIGTLEDIYKKTKDLNPPAIIIVGKVVELYKKLN